MSHMLTHVIFIAFKYFHLRQQKKYIKERTITIPLLWRPTYPEFHILELYILGN